MKMKITLLLGAFLTIGLFSFAQTVSAHPGNTAADGCHYCRTNCEKWGVPYNERHCHGGGSTGSVQGTSTVKEVAPRPVAIPSPKPKKVVIPTVRPTVIPTPKPTVRPTLRPTPQASPVLTCSAVQDSVCPAQCTAGNDADCCTTQLRNYSWYDNWGCYPIKLSCSAVSDSVCDAYCSAGNDADCCVERLDGYQWYDNWGCYPK